MKKTLLALTLVLCLVASLVALTSCGGGEDECEHIWATKATVDKAATCTEEGSESIKCLECGEKKADSVTAIPATGHAYTVDSLTAATCTADGSKTEICTTCGDTTTTTIPATGEHTWSDIPTIDVEATCTTDGSKSIKCTGCQAVKPDSTEVIPAAHVWGAIATTDTPATCTEPGTKSIKCLFCQTKQAGTEQTIPAIGHTGLTIVVPATFFSEGLAEGTCSTCGESGSATVPMTEVESYLFTTSTGDSPDETFIFPYMIGDCKSLSEMYFVVADVYVTAGDGFVVNVKPVETPEENTYSAAEGVELDGKIFFEVATKE